MSSIDTFESMLAKGQDSDMLRFTLGNAYWKEKDFEKASAHLTKAVEFNASYSAAWKVLGRCFLELDKLDQAAAALNSGMQAAKAQGDKQNEKEIAVFLKRVTKKLEQKSQASNQGSNRDTAE